MTQSTTKIALVTGGNKGVGLGICQQLVKKNFRVLLGTRKLENGQNAIKKSFQSNDPIEPIQIDLCNKDVVSKAVQYVKDKYQKIDVLVNNAGMAFKGSAFDQNVVKTTFQTNYEGTKLVTSSFLPLINSNGRIINVSSRAGKFTRVKNKKLRNELLSDNITLKRCDEIMDLFYQAVKKEDEVGDKQKYSIDNDWQRSAYGMSKVGMSTYGRILAIENKNLFVANLCPGYVSTDMSSHQGTRNLLQGAWVATYLATTNDISKLKSGGFYAAVYESNLKKQNLSKDKWESVVECVELDYENPDWAH